MIDIDLRTIDNMRVVDYIEVEEEEADNSLAKAKANMVEDNTIAREDTNTMATAKAKAKDKIGIEVVDNMEEAMADIVASMHTKELDCLSVDFVLDSLLFC